VDAGRTPADHGVLRAAAALVKQLPAAGSGNFRKGFLAVGARGYGFMV